MNYKNVSNYLKNNYGMVVGGDFDKTKHLNHKLNCNGIDVEIHPGVDAGNNTISFITMRFKTNNKAELISVLNGFVNNFSFTGMPVINQSTNFFGVNVYYLGKDSNSANVLKLVLWDKVSTMINQYEIELKIE
jgi:hypothetical protein